MQPSITQLTQKKQIAAAVAAAICWRTGALLTGANTHRGCREKALRHIPSSVGEHENICTAVIFSHYLYKAAVDEG
jgi:hypothetical protein